MFLNSCYGVDQLDYFRIVFMDSKQDFLPVITPVNQKGGVGKTETTILLAEWFAIVRKMRVLVIDTDMQCNTTEQLVGMELAPDAVGGQLPPKHPDFDPNENVEERSTIADIFEGKSVLPYSSWIRDEKDPARGFVEVICGHPHKLEVVNNVFYKPMNQPINKDVHNSLKSFIEDKGDPSDPENTTLKDLYDIIIIDTGPSRTPLFRASIRASTHIIVPFRPEKRDIQGMTAMLQVIESENYNRPNDRQQLNLIGLLPNMVRNPRTLTQKKYLEEVHANHKDILFPEDGWLHLLKAFPERDVEGAKPRSIFNLPANEPARRQATAMATHVEHAIFGKELA